METNIGPCGTYRAGYKPLGSLRNDNATLLTRVPRVLPTTRSKTCSSTSVRQHACHLCTAGCIVISENPPRLITCNIRDLNGPMIRARESIVGV